jgi:hypothetical protein
MVRVTDCTRISYHSVTGSLLRAGRALTRRSVSAALVPRGAVLQVELWQANGLSEGLDELKRVRGNAPDAATLLFQLETLGSRSASPVFRHKIRQYAVVTFILCPGETAFEALPSDVFGSLAPRLVFVTVACCVRAEHAMQGGATGKEGAGRDVEDAISGGGEWSETRLLAWCSLVCQRFPYQVSVLRPSSREGDTALPADGEGGKRTAVVLVFDRASAEAPKSFEESMAVDEETANGGRQSATATPKTATVLVKRELWDFQVCPITPSEGED